MKSQFPDKRLTKQSGLKKKGGGGFTSVYTKSRGTTSNLCLLQTCYAATEGMVPQKKRTQMDVYSAAHVYAFV